MGKAYRELEDYQRGIESNCLHDSTGVHIGNEYYVTLNSPWCYVNISQYVFVSSCIRGLPTGDNISFTLDEWTHFVALLPTIYEGHPELIT